MVEGPSMRPTLVNGERLVVNKFIYRFKAPERGEVLINMHFFYLSYKSTNYQF
jgi:signal peptidase I